MDKHLKELLAECPKYCKRCGAKLKFVYSSDKGEFDTEEGFFIPDILYFAPKGNTAVYKKKFTKNYYSKGTLTGFHEFHTDYHFHREHGYIDCPETHQIFSAEEDFDYF